MTIALCWLAAAVWLAGARTRSRARRTAPQRAARESPVTARRARPLARTLGWAAAAGVAVLAIAVAGPVYGAAVGAAAAPAVGLAVCRVQARARGQPSVQERRCVPLVLDLLAAALRSGQPLGAALAACAPAAGGCAADRLTHVAGLLRLGAEPATAWQAVADDPLLGPVARTACRSAESGIRLASGFEQVAADLRADAAATARARAQRAGVWAMAPLGLCFLPAFVCLGVVPVVVGVARGVFAGQSP